METPTFNGRVTIKVRFRNKGEYLKFRKYILKTEWTPGDAYPTWEELKVEFKCIDDLNRINKTIVMMLQYNLEVYSSGYKMEQQYAEEEHPIENEYPDEDILEVDDYGYLYLVERSRPVVAINTTPKIEESKDP